METKIICKKRQNMKKNIHSFIFLMKIIENISKINWRNSIRLGNAMPMKSPRPPPMLFKKVEGSVLGIWVIFRELKSRKWNLKFVSLCLEKWDTE